MELVFFLLLLLAPLTLLYADEFHNASVCADPCGDGGTEVVSDAPWCTTQLCQNHNVILLVAGSVSCSGEFAALSAELRRGLVLWAAQLNSVYTEGPGGARLWVRLRLEDDRSQADEVRRIYRKLATEQGSGRPAFLVGPYSSDLSLVAAEVTADSGVVLMLPAASAPGIYQQGYGHVYGVGVPAAAYMTDALRLMSIEGAKSIVVASGTGAFSTAVCRGAELVAEGLGLDVLGSFIVRGDNVSLQVHSMSTPTEPDILVGCGYLLEASLLLVSMRALDWNPKGVVLSQAAHPMFVDSVGAENANYVCAPVTWTPEMGDAYCQRAGVGCELFTDGSEFAALYRKHFSNEEPQYQSAGAAAAAIVVMSAVRRAQSLEPSALHRAIRSDSVDTFYGRLAFDAHGERMSFTVGTVQHQPLSKETDPFLRYNSTSPQLLSDARLLWPMPTWEEKELRVYPCSPGSQLAGGICALCPAGYFRHEDMIACQPCEVGSYSTEEGQMRCLPCPPGGNCSVQGMSMLPEAAIGYYRLPLPRPEGDVPGWTFQRCEPEDVCLGGNRCAGSNTGVMCMSCRAGFTDNHGSCGQCVRCPAPAWNVLRGLGVGGVYVLYAYCLLSTSISSAKSIQYLHAVILKIVFNYAVFAHLGMKATGFWDRFVQSAGTLLGNLIPSESNAVFISLDCLLQESSWRLLQARVVMAMVGIPVTLALNLLFLGARNFFLLRRVLRHSSHAPQFPSDFQTMNLGGDEARRGSGKGSGTSFGAAGDPLHGLVNQRNSTFVSSEAGGVDASLPGPSTHGSFFAGGLCFETGNMWLSTGRVTEAGTASSDIGSDELSTNDIVRWLEFWPTVTQSSIIWAFLLYPGIVETLLQGVLCQDFDQPRLRGNLDVICFEGDHLGVFIWCVVGLFVYGGGVPAAFLYLLWWERHRLMCTKIWRRYSFLYNGFEHQYFYYESIYMVQKLCLCCAASLHQIEIRLMSLLCLGLLYYAHHMRTNPFDNRDYYFLDRLGVLNLWCFIMTVLGRLLLLTQEQMGTQMEGSSFLNAVISSPLFTASVVVAVATAHAAFWSYASLGLLRTLVVRPLRIRRDCGMRLSWWQRLLLSLEQAHGRGNAAQFRVDNRTLDISSLSGRERSFLNKALKQALVSYTQASHELKPNLLVLALTEAALICKRTQLLQVEALQNANEFAPSWLRWCERLCSRCVGFSLPAGLSAPNKCVEKPAPVDITTEDVISVYVEDLHDALMLLWPDILQGRPELHVLPQTAPPQGPGPCHTNAWNEAETIKDIDEHLKYRPRALPEATEPIHQSPFETTREFSPRHAEKLRREARRRSLRLVGQLVLERVRAQRSARELHKALSSLAAMDRTWLRCTSALSVQGGEDYALNSERSLDSTDSPEQALPTLLGDRAQFDAEGWAPAAFLASECSEKPSSRGRGTAGAGESTVTASQSDSCGKHIHKALQPEGHMSPVTTVGDTRSTSDLGVSGGMPVSKWRTECSRTATGSMQRRESLQGLRL